ncbi:bifunctional diguanylate cyclase/phosphodiesterase [Aquabacterium sp. A08]|uniref:putative bifunctional diguanylate cyclase/phosphodiesterase n=1 Tax=Aquabacterium sp. A08 TaxID=2718532 RepID=UPI00142087DB|nr:GGDEF domain-containing phosphodiesterase [Aquabacterium sp. A08]NIC41104.1 EAL domain-containing protein [Aquabacterium sp. A08]
MTHTIHDRDLLASLVQSSDDAIITKSLDGTVLTWNSAAARIFGHSAHEMVGQKMLKIFPPDRVHEEDDILRRLARGERIEHFRTQRLHKSGALLDISVSISPILGPHGQVVAAAKIARDITEQVRAEREIAQYKALIDSSEDAIISKDLQGIIRTWNAGAQRIFGYSAEEAVGQHVGLLFPKERLHEEDKLLRTVLSGGVVRHFRTTRLTRDGRRIFASISLSPIRTDTGEIIGFSKIVRDLTQEIQQEQQLWQAVHYDSLTGAMSRTGIHNAVDDLIRISQVRQRSIAVVHCNLNGFAHINAHLSPDVGDRVLVKVAQTLREVVREADDIGRLHADHFVVLLQGFSQPASMATAVDKIRAAIAGITEVDGHPLRLSASVGVAVYPEDGKSCAGLLRKAEQAARTARLKGSGGVQFFSQPHGKEVPEDFFIVQGLNQALEKGQLHLEYQPMVEARTGRPVKVEALLRWTHPELGRVSPAVFIPLAEKYGLVRPLSRWVLRQAMADLARWTHRFGMDFQVSVNRSSHDFHDLEECHHEMREALHEFGLCGRNLIVEVTEYSLVGSTSVTENILKAYRALGVQVALDDFGTGYSSLDYLKRYPVDCLKIDKGFVDTLAFSSVDQQLCEGIVGLAKRLGLQVVAEGVETAAQEDILCSMGVDFIQGYLHAQPMRAEALETYLGQALGSPPA